MRANSIYAYFCSVLAINTMKARLNLTIEQTLLDQVKKFAAQKNTSVSELVEDYFKVLTKPKKQSLVDLLRSLPKPDISDDRDLIEEYYEAKRKKYGL
ncbi:MAG: DUF6364 family protein [Sediminibacterium sp.]|jgi:hypothetical protein|nr:DUF6364 family protein [Sediminibacterium sp.]